MSNGTPPPRRRIAGESPTAKKAPAKKAPAKKAATETPVKKAPAAKKAPVKKVPAAKEPARSPAPVVPQVARPTLKPRADKPRADKSSADAPRAERTSDRDASSVSPVALGVAAILLVAGAVVGVLGFTNWRGSDFASSQSQAVSAAGSAAETIFSFRYDQLDEHTTESKALMTPKYAKEFDTIVPTLTDVAPDRKVTVKAVTRDAAALPCGDECSLSKTSVLIFLDQDRRLADDDTSTVFGNRIVVTMVKSKGDWKVSDIRAL